MRRIVLKGKNLVGREDTFEDGEKGRHGYLLLERSDASIFLQRLRRYAYVHHGPRGYVRVYLGFWALFPLRLPEKN
jgi:hypothetical protein